MGFFIACKLSSLLVLLGSSKSPSLGLSYAELLRSCSWCLSTKEVWHCVIPLCPLSTHSSPHAAVMSAAVAAAISLPILGMPLQVPPDFSEHVHQLESNVSWRLSEPAQHPPGTSCPCTPAATDTSRPAEPGFTRPGTSCPWAPAATNTSRARVHRGPPGCCQGLPRCPDLLPRLASVLTKPVLRLNHRMQDYKVITDKDYSRLNSMCKSLHASNTC